jgi:type II secretory pathway component PulF
MNKSTKKDSFFAGIFSRRRPTVARPKKYEPREKLKSQPMFMHFSVYEQAHFAKRLAMVLRSGIPILEGLSMIATQYQSRSSSYIYGHLLESVANGHSLSSSMSKFRTIFGDFCINIVRVGETSGTLHENLDYLAEELKKKQALKKKVIGALVYPAVIIFATIGISLVLTVYIFPKITPIFQSFHSELPLTTRILINFSGFLMQSGLWLLLGIVVSSVGIGFSMRIRSLRLLRDKAILKLPLLGTLSQYYNIANMTRTLSLLLKSDVGVVTALSIVRDSTQNLAYREALQRIETEVVKGHKISHELLKNQHLFPTLVSQMVMVGEQTGNLSDSLMYISNMYDEEITDLTKNLTTMLEPILMVVMGLVVGFIAISIITPIYGITQQLTPR